MLIENGSMKDMLITVLRTINNNFNNITNDCKMAMSENKKYVAIYVKYEIIVSGIINVIPSPEIIILKFVDDEINGFEIYRKIIISKDTLVTGLDINYDGSQVAIGCINQYKNTDIPNEEYVRIVNFSRDNYNYGYYDITPKTNNILFGHNVLFINGRNLENDEDTFKYSILLIASPLAKNGRGDFNILGSSKGEKYKEVNYQETYFRKLLDSNNIRTDFFGSDITHLEYVINFIELNHTVDISEDTIKLIPIE